MKPQTLSFLLLLAATRLPAGALPVTFDRVDLTKAPAARVEMNMIAAGKGPNEGKFYVTADSGSAAPKVLSYNTANKSWASWTVPANANFFAIATAGDGGVAVTYLNYLQNRPGLGYIDPAGRLTTQDFNYNDPKIGEAPVSIAFSGNNKIWGAEGKSLILFDRQTGGTWGVTRTQLPSGTEGLSDIDVDDAGKVWYTSPLSRMFGSYADRFEPIALNQNPPPEPVSVAARNSTLYLADMAGRIVFHSQTGGTTFCPVPNAQRPEPAAIAASADGYAYYVQPESRKVGRMVSTCSFDDFVLGAELPGKPLTLALSTTQMAVLGGNLFAAATFMLVADVPVVVCLITVTAPTISVEVGAPVTGTVSAAGGKAPYKFTASQLPKGVSMSEAGVLSGVAEQEGTYNVNVNVTDGATPPCRGSNTFTITVVKASGPDLTITKSHHLDGDGTLTYTMVVKNIGTAKSFGAVEVKDAFPSGFTPDIPWPNDQKVVVDSIGFMLPGESRTVTAKGRWDGKAKLENQAEVMNTSDVDSTNNKSNVDVCCAALTVTGEIDMYDFGIETLSVKLVVRNIGHVATGAPVTLKGSWTGFEGTTPGINCPQAGGEFTCTRDTPLAPGATKHIFISARLRSHVSGSITATASAPDTREGTRTVFVGLRSNGDIVIPAPQPKSPK